MSLKPVNVILCLMAKRSQKRTHNTFSPAFFVRVCVFFLHIGAGNLKKQLRFHIFFDRRVLYGVLIQYYDTSRFR